MPGESRSRPPEPLLANDNVTGCSTLYDGAGAASALQVKIPLPGNVVAPATCKHVIRTALRASLPRRRPA